MKKINLDSSVYIIIRSSVFIIASIVSALLNLFLFTSLDNSYIWLLASISICLEGTKVSTIITRNCFASIYEKVRKVSIKAKQHVFMFFYLTLAFLSIIAGLGFSLTITARTEATNSLTLATKQAQYQTLTEQIEKIENKKLEISELNKSVGSNVDSYEPFIRANQKYQESEAEYISANSAYRTALANRSGMTEGSQEYIAATAEITRTNQLLSAASTARSLTKSEADRVKINFNDFQTSSETVVKRLNDDLITLNEELKILISQCNLTSEIGSVALLELDNQIKEEQNKHIIEKGMSFMFEEFAKYLHTTPELVKLWILLFVAILIELTIYQTSPDIKISRKVLYFFRNSIPHDVSIVEILEKFDGENKQYEDIVEEKTTKEKIEQKIEPVEVIKEKKPKRKYVKRQPKLPTAEDMRKAVDSVNMERLFPNVENKKLEEELKEIDNETPEESEKHIEELEQKLSHLEVMPEQTVEAQVIVENENKTNHYRFGKTTKSVADKLVLFVRECIDSPGAFRISPEQGAKNIRLNNKAKEVFLGHLANVRLGEKFLISKNNFGEYEANFTAEEIINYATEIIND